MAVSDPTVVEHRIAIGAPNDPVAHRRRPKNVCPASHRHQLSDRDSRHVVDTCITLRLLEIRTPSVIGVVAPPIRGELREPSRGRILNVIPQRDQHGDLEQCRHTSSSSGRRPSKSASAHPADQKPEINQPRQSQPDGGDRAPSGPPRPVARPPTARCCEHLLGTSPSIRNVVRIASCYGKRSQLTRLRRPPAALSPLTIIRRRGTSKAGNLPWRRRCARPAHPGQCRLGEHRQLRSGVVSVDS